MISSGVRPSSPLQRIAVMAFVSVCTCGPSVIRKAQLRCGVTFKNTPTVSVHSSSLRMSSRSKVSPSRGPCFMAAEAYEMSDSRFSASGKDSKSAMI